MTMPAPLVQAVVDELRAESGGRELAINIAELPAVRADPTLLRQIFFNLVSNAIKYSRERSPAEISVGFLPGPPVTFYVKDNGAGFDMTYSRKLFQVFQRLHRPEEFAGTGVGLAIVKRIVQRHGGRVWAEGREGEGATFYFTLEGGEQDHAGTG
jgi:light-regulated signal transduction histidine kinase (bacteriophytochrome)